MKTTNVFVEVIETEDDQGVVTKTLGQFPLYIEHLIATNKRNVLPVNLPERPEETRDTGYTLSLTLADTEAVGTWQSYVKTAPQQQAWDERQAEIAEREAAELDRKKVQQAQAKATELAQVKAADELLETLSDEDVETLTYLYPEWEVGMVTAAHDALPDVKGHRKLRYKGLLYRVVQGHTTQSDWTPDITPALFVRFRDPAAGPQPWVQPTGAHDTYNAGAVVTHNGQTWDNTHGDGNSWEPGVYGWAAR